MRAGEPRSTAWRRFLCLLVGTGAAVLLVAGCVAPPRAADEVVLASGADLESANPLVTVHPLSRQVQRHVLLVTLARYDTTMQPEPYFARAWSWSGDRRTLTLRLASSLHWHDGPRTTAADVIFTLGAAQDPATGYARAGELAGMRAGAPDDTTVVLRFEAAQPGLPAFLSELPILPRHHLAGVPLREMRRAAWNLAPVGNGPFRFVERRAGQRWVFRRNDRFPAALGGPPALERLVIAVVDEATTKYAALASGDVDVAGIAPGMAALAGRDPALRVLDYPVLFSTALVFNPHRPPFDDARVRRAVGLALQRQRIVEAAVAGFATPAAGPVPPASALALPAEAEYNAARADSLLDAAGWRRGRDGARARDGRPFEVELLTVGSGDNAVEQLVQADLAARGIAVRIRVAEMGSFLAEARAATKRFDLLYTGVPGDVSLAYLAAMYDSRQAGGALDYAGFHTPRLDAHFAAIRSAGDTSVIRREWWAVQQLLREQAPAAWVYHARGIQGLSARLQEVRMDLRGELATVARWRTAAMTTAGGAR